MAHIVTASKEGMSNPYSEIETKSLVVSGTNLETSTWLSDISMRPNLAFSVRTGKAHFLISLTPAQARILARNLNHCAERRELMQPTAGEAIP